MVKFHLPEWSMQMKSDAVTADGCRPVDWVGRPEMEPLTRAEQLLIECYRRMSEQDRRAMIRFAEVLARVPAPG